MVFTRAKRGESMEQPIIVEHMWMDVVFVVEKDK
jgi:hypothetical protein